MKQITISCYLNGLISVISNDNQYMGENNATQIIVNYPPLYVDYKKRVDILIGKTKTPIYLPADLNEQVTGNQLIVKIPSSVTLGGYYHIQPIAFKEVVGQVSEDIVKWKEHYQVPVQYAVGTMESVNTPTVIQSLTNYIDALTDAQDSVISGAISDIDASLAVKSVNVTTLLSTEVASGSMVREADGLTLNLSIPAGAKVVSAGFDEDDLVFTLDDASTVSIVGGYTTLHGASAYQIWLDAGNVGTEATYLLSLKGDTGAKGDTPIASEQTIVDAGGYYPTKNTESAFQSIGVSITSINKQLENYPNVSIEMGSYDLNGIETPNGYRIRPTDYIDLEAVGSVTLTKVVGYLIYYYLYDKNHVKVLRSNIGVDGESKVITVDSVHNYYYLTWYVERQGTYPYPALQGDNDYSDYFGLSMSITPTFAKTSELVAVENSITELGFMDDIMATFVPSNNFSDLTIIDGKVYCFKASDNATQIGSVMVYAIDFENKTATREKSIYHHWGHCNSVDYCEETDCLIIAYEYNYDGTYIANKFYIVPNAKQVLSVAEYQTIPDLNVCGIEYDCTTYTYGDYLNVCWGYNNYGAYDQCIINSDTMKSIRILQLGKGANNLGLGAYVEASAGAFNGSFKVLSTHTLSNPNNRVNQGADFYNGMLYLGVGHVGSLVWEVSLKHDGTADISRELYAPFYGSDGTSYPTGSTEGIAVTHKYIIENVSSGLGNRVEIRKR